jgi:fluoroacetyl-CoA thioesterase
MNPTLKPGLRRVQEIPIDVELTVPALSGAFAGFADMPPVLATAFMVGFIEWTCIEALRPYLEPDERSLGTLVDVTHVAATPVGMTVTAEVEIVEIRGRKVRFKVACRNDLGLIGDGFHERAVVDRRKFMARFADKAGDANFR